MWKWKPSIPDNPEEVWRRRSDGQLIAAARSIGDYTDDGVAIIRAELRRRGLAQPYFDLPVYRVRTPELGTMDIVSVLPTEVAFASGVPIEAVVGRLRKLADEGGTLTPDNFGPNPVFADFLHDVIARHGPSQPDVIAEARRLGSGRVYVIDLRTRTPDGAVPQEDIIGAFGIDGGLVTPGSYQRNPNHVVLSSAGFFRLDPALHERLLAELAARRSPDNRAPA